MTNEIKEKTYETKFEIVETKSDLGIFAGYASIFDEVDNQNDRVVRGAFKSDLSNWAKKKEMPKMLWQHNEQEVIGVWSKIQEDSKGLYVEGKLLLDVAKAKEAYALIKEKALHGLSIGYVVKQALRGNKVEAVRLLTELDLLEISLVTFPANRQARISAVKNSSIAAEN